MIKKTNNLQMYVFFSAQTGCLGGGGLKHDQVRLADLEVKAQCIAYLRQTSYLGSEGLMHTYVRLAVQEVEA